MLLQKNRKVNKDYASTNINNLSYVYNLSTIYTQITTYNNGLLHHIKYLHDML